MTSLAHLSAAGLYLLAAASGTASFPSRRRLLHLLLGIAAGVHALGIYSLHLEDPAIPLESTPAALSLIGWLVATSYLLSLPLVRTFPVGLWVGCIGGVLTLCAALGFRIVTPVGPAATGAWPHAHVLLSAAGFALLGLSALSGLAYLVKQRGLKRKRASRFELPSLESLERLEHLGLSLGFSMLTLGVLSGYGWVLSRGLDPWSSHASLLLVAWLVFLVPVTLRLLRGERGLRVSRTVVLGFGILAFCYLGGRLLGSFA